MSEQRSGLPITVQSWKRVADGAFQGVLVTALWLSYLALRHVVEGDRAESMRHSAEVWSLERALHLPREDALQAWFLQAEWAVRGINAVYAYAHFPAIIATLVLLHVRRPETFRWFRNVLILTTALALAVHAAYPLAPPRMRPDLGMVDTGIVMGQSTYSTSPGEGFANQYAAMPSMHVAWAVLIAVAAVMCLRSRWRFVVPVYAVGVLMVVVVTGNHYWLDGVVGVALLLVALGVFARTAPNRVDRRTQVQRSCPADEIVRPSG